MNSHIFLSLLGAFGRSFIGIIQTPYVTYRNISQKEDLRMIPFIIIFVGLYLALAGLARGGLGHSPLFLTKSFIKISSGIILTYIFATLTMGVLGKYMKGDVKWSRLGVLWAWTLIPTSIWFTVSSLFFILLPPPRTPSLWGQLASALFLSLSLGILMWKGVLYYLTLRFGLRIDMSKIIAISLGFFPIMAIYSVFLYRLGVFRIPFI